MNMPEGEVCDRYTILRMKARLDEKAAQLLEGYDVEVKLLMEKAAREGFPGRFLDSLLTLQESNSKIWSLEASMRKEFKNDPAAQENISDAEFGRRAMAIRDHNKMRVAAKAEIDEMFGRIPEPKVEHASIKTDSCPLNDKKTP